MEILGAINMDLRLHFALAVLCLTVQTSRTSTSFRDVILPSTKTDIDYQIQLDEEKRGRRCRRSCRNVAFQASVSPTIKDIKADETILFEEIETNIGGAFDAKSGIFTTPVAGTYVFHSTILTPPRSVVETALHVNGEVKMLLYSGDNSLYSPGSNMAVLQLKVGDLVKMVRNGPWGKTPFTIHRGFSTFSGFLLQAD
ncbi:complement C1q tumor necrosis factor-related protein 3-like [Mercenaria mercenaria]|uniref:complement C1q tumor necrosis factor-related protein 3-like n=1 Tax=Mercenaria mercenaria TaxID=6596 RepID=UPI00234F46CB|nr:complement C1q tumor necrosis factor-related protein 3-like [Mercenaria mercenaria]